MIRLQLWICEHAPVAGTNCQLQTAT
jgi:hypothetical protein